MIEGKRVELREIEEDDLERIVRWRNDQDTLKWLFSYRPLCMASQRKWYERYLEDDSLQTFIIELKQDQLSIGTVSLSDIDHKNQRGELGILIGEKEFRGKGLGKESLELLMDYAFSQENLGKIKAHVFSDNLGAIKLYEQCGFVLEGTLRKETYKDGRFKDVCIMSAFRD